jgi:prephenate dehydrogenase
MPPSRRSEDGSGADAPEPPFRRVAIVGSGLIGGSLGLAIKARWPSTFVVAVDRPDVVETAVRMGAADAGAGELARAAGADLVVLAAPVESNIRTLRDLAPHVPGEAIVTDVGSTKRETVRAAAVLPERLQFIGGHPIAGAAVGGVTAARPDLFVGQPWILTPAGDGEPGTSRLGHWLGALGATVHCLTPEAHDALVAVLSHLPQLTASALMHVVGEMAKSEGLALAGRGLRDTTRLASSPKEVWRDIVRTNQDKIGPAVDALVEVLRAMRDDLDGRSGAVERTFESAASWKAVLERQSAGRARTSTRTVTRTYVEMRSPEQLHRVAAPEGEPRVERVRGCPPAFWRFLYAEVGRRYRWVDRLDWSDETIRAYLADPAVSLWLLTVSGVPAGYFELRESDGAVEIAYFGLLEAFHGRGFGGYLLTEAVDRAWRTGASRVWLHTNTLDHPAAIPNYLARGFTIFKTEEYSIQEGE